MRHPVTPPPSGARSAPAGHGRRPGGPATAARPVFVDPSGRRQRRVRRIGRLLAIPAAGYVALLLSAALGGPSVDAPYLPRPAAGGHGPGAGATVRPTATGGAAHRTPSSPDRGGPASAPPAAPGTAGAGPTADRTTPRASVSGGTTAPATAPVSPTAAPTVTHGKSTATHPVPTHTGRGRG
jgi:hypothetical protein